eukprot:CAMPEP_0198226664 /NCGR_PEP_ID=MMETSP1445-20131203/106127_1 /TAXON_ID=36898 /ORGANISM="Pyramimonas sp., Strain CCMP2087" /LENGTH=41 /DNA_ID= /DNA_START= /DNA_END= /DNA_ORIENTATION=
MGKPYFRWEAAVPNGFHVYFECGVVDNSTCGNGSPGEKVTG